jgi:arylsulfatase A-like enzyme
VKKTSVEIRIRSCQLGRREMPGGESLEKCAIMQTQDLTVATTYKPLGTLIVVLASAIAAQAAETRVPSFVVLLADDLGYGDLACYGHPTIRTPHLDQMAAEGLRFTQYYASCYCTPSRAALLTGRLPVRSGLNRVLGPKSTGGIADGELTLAEALRTHGFATKGIGKWHLGSQPQFLPTRHGFDHYFGIPYSNDMDRAQEGEPPIPLLRDETVIEQPVVQESLTKRYTEEAVGFIRSCARVPRQGRPFFLYLAYTFPHVPLHASPAFRGKSPRGLYGDVVEELDASVGQILQTLREEKLADSTLVVFTSDNGPWLAQGLNAGTAGLLRAGKGTTWEGGVRVPCVAWWPGTIAPGRVVQDLASELDLFTTCVELAGGKLPADRPNDSWSLVSVLRGSEHGSRYEVFYYYDNQVTALRQGPWKLHVTTIDNSSGTDKLQNRWPPLLFNLALDPSERFDVAREHPGLVERLVKRIEAHRASVEPGTPQF